MVTTEDPKVLKNWVVLVVVETAQFFETIAERNGFGDGRSDGFGQFATCHIATLPAVLASAVALMTRVPRRQTRNGRASFCGREMRGGFTGAGLQCDSKDTFKCSSVVTR